MGQKKDEYHKLINLYVKQKWLTQRKDKLRELIDFCEDSDSKDLVFSLLERFSYLESETLKMLLDDIADYIVNKSGFKQETIQILSMTYDDEADSGQKVLYEIKHPIFQKGWRSIKTVNVFGKSIKNYNKGKTEILLLDEFIGSGQTLKIRIDYLKGLIVNRVKQG